MLGEHRHSIEPQCLHCRQFLSTGVSQKKAAPRKGSSTLTPKLAGRKGSNPHDYVDKECGNRLSSMIEQSCEAGFESNKAVFVTAAS